MDEVRLTLPHDPRFLPVAHLVLGGLGSRLDVTVDGLDDLRLAVDSLVESGSPAAEVTIVVRADGSTLVTEVGPFASAELERALDAGRAGELGLRRILDTVADRVSVDPGDGGAWVTLEKRLAG